jgi:hypothetical protein
MVVQVPTLAPTNTPTDRPAETIIVRPPTQYPSQTPTIAPSRRYPSLLLAPLAQTRAPVGNFHPHAANPKAIGRSG